MNAICVQVRGEKPGGQCVGESGASGARAGIFGKQNSQSA